MNNEHPWKGLGLKDQLKTKALFKAWLALNKDVCLKQGMVRADGKVFHTYQYGYKDGEHWTTPENFEKQKARVRQTQKRIRATPEGRAKFNDFQKDQYISNPAYKEKMRLRGLKHRELKPENNRASSMRRYVAKWKQTHPQLDKEIERGLYAEAVRLTAETGIEFHVDHIIPIKHGGWHHHDNLQIIPYWVNNRKSTDPFWRSRDMAFRDWRDVPAGLWPDQLRNEYSKQMKREPDYLLTG